MHRTYRTKISLVHGKYAIHAEAVGYGSHRGVRQTQIEAVVFRDQHGAPAQIRQCNHLDYERTFLNVVQKLEQCGVSQAGSQQVIDFAQARGRQNNTVASLFYCGPDAVVKSIPPVIESTRRRNRL